MNFGSRRFVLAACVLMMALSFAGCGGGGSSSPGGSGGPPPPPSTFQLTVSVAGTGSVSSNPAGISCGQTCTANFNSGTVVQLTAVPDANSTFAGWGGACSGTGTCQVTLQAAQSVTASFTSPGLHLTVLLSGTGTGTVTSSPAGINCGTTCDATFTSGTVVQLTPAAANGSTFAGWSGDCAGTGACSVTVDAARSVTATFNVVSQPTLQGSINHIIFMLQENRSLDHYFGALRQYWEDNHYPDQPFDGLPQFPLSNPSGLAPTNPGCDPASPPPAQCVVNANSPAVTSFHLQTICMENPSPSWNEAHTQFNVTDPISSTATLDGFVKSSAHDARDLNFFDSGGLRAMGYYDGVDLNYYYYMATQFGTSDRWFAPVMTRTLPNRLYLLAGTSHGHVYPLGTSHTPPLSDATIFEILQNAGVSWKIYVHPGANGLTDPQSLFKQSYIQNFTYGQTILTTFPQNIAPIAEYFTDLQNGTLPQVALIEPASSVALDEHPSDADTGVPPNIRAGANYVSSIVNALMTSSSWKDSAFILSYDEHGGLYDHVSPQPTVNPDGIAPTDLQSGDTCTKGLTGPTCDFTYTGYRVPLIVVSPFAKKNYVSHTVADYTAILKLIETRFGLASLTLRDAAQMDMTEFFDFANPPWTTPPTPPLQTRGGACYLDHLP
jgi:phospholipase C